MRLNALLVWSRKIRSNSSRKSHIFIAYFMVTFLWHECTYLELCISNNLLFLMYVSCSYSFINGLEMLNIVGTYEKAEMEEGEVYEVVNIKTLKQATPNLRIINLYGINFVDDSHIEAFSSNCIQLQVRNGPNYKKNERIAVIYSEYV